MTAFDLDDRGERDRVMRMTDAELAVYRARHLQPLRELVAYVTAQRAYANAALAGAAVPELGPWDRGGVCRHGARYSPLNAIVTADGRRQCSCVPLKGRPRYAFAT